MKPGYFSVRAMGQGDDEFELFFERSVVAIGWSAVDFSALPDPKAVRSEVDKRHYAGRSGVVPQVRGRKLSEVQRFKAIRPDDRLVVPFGNAVRLGIATEEELYDPEAGERLDLANQRRVNYLVDEVGDLVTVPRSELSEGLQRRLRVRGSTVSDLTEFSDEIEGLFSSEGRRWSTRMYQVAEAQRASFLDELLSNIRMGQTNLKAGGRGLEELVRDLLVVEGYEAKILGKGVFPGAADADIVASRADRFGEDLLLVQVKHHHGTTGTYGVEQLLKVLEAMPDEYAEHRLMMVTSAEGSEALEEIAEDRDVIFVPGIALVEWIEESLDDLPEIWKATLGISPVRRFTVVATSATSSNT